MLALSVWSNHHDYLGHEDFFLYSSSVCSCNLFLIASVKPLPFLKRQKYRTLKDELPGSVGTQYATVDQWRSNSRTNEEVEPMQKQHPAVDVTGDGSRI